ncbi:MAG: aldose 1-epimerase [Reyranella sp.]|nr:aldose 1-epimerase [Reyranella sp.]
MRLLSLRAGRLAVDIAPFAGGSITRFTAGESIDVLRPASAGAIASGTSSNASCYPLVPFSNRIANGRLAVDGADIVLEPNWPGVRHPMHGDGWARAWDVERHDAHGAELAYTHDGCAGWPFRYRARQSFRLEDDCFVVGMSIENLESRAVPAGIGLHPFFTRDADSELACRTRGVWRTDGEVLPTERIDVPPEWDFSASRPVDNVVLDNCFDGWDGHAMVTWPSRKLRLDLTATEPFRHLVIYIPEGSRYFCVEPVSHASGAVGRSLLAVGATLAGDIVFRLSNL